MHRVVKLVVLLKIPLRAFYERGSSTAECKTVYCGSSAPVWTGISALGLRVCARPALTTPLDFEIQKAGLRYVFGQSVYTFL